MTDYTTYLDKILNIDDYDKVYGEIYVITNIITGKKYIGQTVTHRKNKNKYRPFGSISRLKDHISEAINNTKENQCKILNNSIRKHGSHNFDVKLITRCKKKK